MMKITDEIVTRFLGWRLPDDFAPDCGITFDGRKADQWNPGGKGWPVGTNLLTATQAKAMLEHVLSDEPSAIAPIVSEGFYCEAEQIRFSLKCRDQCEGCRCAVDRAESHIEQTNNESAAAQELPAAASDPLPSESAGTHVAGMGEKETSVQQPAAAARPAGETPETDREITILVLPDNPQAEYVPAEHARQMERKRNAALDRLANAELDRDAHREEVRRLRERSSIAHNEVWEVASRTISILCATEELAKKYVSSFSPTVSGGMSISKRFVLRTTDDTAKEKDGGPQR